MRVEVIDNEGIKTSIEREGELLNEGIKPLTIRSIVKFLEDQLSSPSVRNSYEGEELTIKERLASFLRYDEGTPEDWFTTSEIKRIYEEVYEEEARLSTISTYLARMYSDGILERTGSRARRKYRLAPSERAKVAKVMDSAF